MCISAYLQRPEIEKLFFHLTISIMVCSSRTVPKYMLILLFLVRLETSNATIVTDTLDAKRASRADEIVLRHGTQRKTTATNVSFNDDTATWRVKSRGLGVGESTKKVSNKKDSMGKLVSREEEGDEILQEKTKVKAKQRDKEYKGKSVMNSDKKMKGAPFASMAKNIHFSRLTHLHYFSSINYICKSSHRTSSCRVGCT